MNFEINGDKKWLPDEEDIYGVNDIEERERFDQLLGIGTSQAERIRRRKLIMHIVAVLVITSFALPGIYFLLRLFRLID